MDVIGNPGRELSREIATREGADAQIDHFISRRHDRRVTEEGERPAEEAWMESERRHDALRRAALRAEWCEYHWGQIERHKRNLAALVARHERDLARLMERGAA